MKSIKTFGERHRYIGFKITCDKSHTHISRTELIKAINDARHHTISEHGKTFEVRLTRYDGTIGILKCQHHHKNQAIQLLESICSITSHPLHIHTIATSGTIHALLKHPEMHSK